MNTPFPGMDPWVEHPVLWPDVHNRLIAALADVIAPMIAPRSHWFRSTPPCTASTPGRATIWNLTTPCRPGRRWTPKMQHGRSRWWP